MLEKFIDLMRHLTPKDQAKLLHHQETEEAPTVIRALILDSPGNFIEEDKRTLGNTAQKKAPHFIVKLFELPLTAADIDCIVENYTPESIISGYLAQYQLTSIETQVALHIAPAHANFQQFVKKTGMEARLIECLDGPPHKRPLRSAIALLAEANSAYTPDIQADLAQLVAASGIDLTNARNFVSMAKSQAAKSTAHHVTPTRQTSLRESGKRTPLHQRNRSQLSFWLPPDEATVSGVPSDRSEEPCFQGGASASTQK